LHPHQGLRFLHGRLMAGPCRKRSTFADYGEAKTEAEQVATRLTRGDLDVLTVTSADRAAYLRAKQLFHEVDVPIASGAAQFAEAKRKLGDIPLIHAVDYYLKKRPRNLKPQPIRKVVEEILQAKKADGLSEGYLNHLHYDLKKFAGAFQCNIGTVTRAEIDSWLRSLGVSNRTRNNFRASIQTLVNFAMAGIISPRIVTNWIVSQSPKTGAVVLRFSRHRRYRICSHVLPRITFHSWLWEPSLESAMLKSSALTGGTFISMPASSKSKQPRPRPPADGQSRYRTVGFSLTTPDFSATHPVLRLSGK